MLAIAAGLPQRKTSDRLKTAEKAVGKRRNLQCFKQQRANKLSADTFLIFSFRQRSFPEAASGSFMSESVRKIRHFTLLFCRVFFDFKTFSIVFF